MAPFRRLMASDMDPKMRGRYELYQRERIARSRAATLGGESRPGCGENPDRGSELVFSDVHHEAALTEFTLDQVAAFQGCVQAVGGVRHGPKMRVRCGEGQREGPSFSSAPLQLVYSGSPSR